MKVAQCVVSMGESGRVFEFPVSSSRTGRPTPEYQNTPLGVSLCALDYRQCCLKAVASQGQVYVRRSRPHQMNLFQLATNRLLWRALKTGR
jgi:hypothetical protein